jgi:hypothetical protein
MIYLYYDKKEKKLYVSAHHDDPLNIGPVQTDEIVYDDVETVNADPERGQILVHGGMGEGIIAEYPIQRTVLTCRLPIRRKIKKQ